MSTENELEVNAEPEVVVETPEVAPVETDSSMAAMLDLLDESTSDEVKVEEPLAIESQPIAAAPVAEAQPVTEPQPTEAELLRTQLNELSMKLYGQPFQAPVTLAPAIVPPAQAPAAIAPQVPQSIQQVLDDLSKTKNYLTSEELDDIVDKPELINKALNDVARYAQENVLKLVPVIASQMVTQQIAMNEIVRDFYEANKDLVPFRQFVGMVATDVAQSNPNKAYGEVLKEVATKVREKLALKPATVVTTVPVQQKVQQPGVKPAFAGSVQGARRGGEPVVDKNSMVAQLADLMN